MTCFSVNGAIVCTRGRARPIRERPRCRHPGCDRNATQAGYACRAHFFLLPPDLRARLGQAERLELAANRRLGRAWQACAAEADKWIAEQLARPSAPKWRQPELPL